MFFLKFLTHLCQQTIPFLKKTHPKTLDHLQLPFLPYLFLVISLLLHQNTCLYLYLPYISTTLFCLVLYFSEGTQILASQGSLPRYSLVPMQNSRPCHSAAHHTFHQQFLTTFLEQVSCFHVRLSDWRPVYVPFLSEIISLAFCQPLLHILCLIVFHFTLN